MYRLVRSSSGLSVALTPLGGLLFLSPVFLRALAAFNDFIDLADDVLPVCQEVPIFIDRRIPRRHLRPVDVGDIWEWNETSAVGTVDLFYRPVPLKLRLAALGTFNDLGRFVGFRMHVRPGVAYKRRRSWLVSVGKSRGLWYAPRKVCDEQNKGPSSTTRSDK